MTIDRNLGFFGSNVDLSGNLARETYSTSALYKQLNRIKIDNKYKRI